MSSFNSKDEFIRALGLQIQQAHKEPKGALFTAALVPSDNRGYLFVTGKVVFLDEPADGRGALKYPALILVEEWVAGVNDSIDRLSQLLQGKAVVAGVTVQGKFAGTYGERNVQNFPSRFTAWSEWCFKTSWHHEGSRPGYNNDPVLAFGLPAFQSVRAAVSAWVYGRDFDWGSDAPHQNELNVIVPDTRARISEAKWEGAEVVVTIESNCSVAELELHAVFDSKKDRSTRVSNPASSTRLKVPDDASSVWLALVHNTGESMGEFFLNQAYPNTTEKAEESPREAQVLHDFMGGENERVEYKPFIRPGEAKDKDTEIIRTTIAFANTHGGRILLGVDDERNLLGSDCMHTALRCGDEDAERRLRDWARKLIHDRCKPVPQFSVYLVQIHGELVGVIDVKAGARHERPFQTHQNAVFVRKGSTNVMPDMKTEWSTYFGNDGVSALPGILGDSI